MPDFDCLIGIFTHKHFKNANQMNIILSQTEERINGAGSLLVSVCRFGLMTSFTY